MKIHPTPSIVMGVKKFGFYQHIRILFMIKMENNGWNEVGKLGGFLSKWWVVSI
jgi:hypothetical protein